jgi:hypothetical protein
MVTGTYLLSGLWPPFREAALYLLDWTSYLGYEGEIVSGYRSWEEQSRLYQIGRTPAEVANRVSKQGRDGSVTDAPPGASAHNYGLAIDIEGRDQTAIVALARQIGFGTVSWDPAHIEWPNWQSLLRR